MSLTCNINQLNNIIPSKRALYDILSHPFGNFKYYLPEYESRAVTEEYLLALIHKKYFILPKAKKLEGTLIQRVSKWELVDEIESLTQMKLGLRPENYPPKEWLVNVLNSLNPNHRFLTLPFIEIQRTIPQE